MLKTFIVLAALLFPSFAAPVYAQATVAAVATSTEELATPDPGDVTAPPDNTWTIPYGSMIDGGAQVIIASLSVFIAGSLAWAARLLPGMTGVFARLLLANMGDRLIQNATDYAINATKGATKDAKLNINVGSEVIARAGEYATSVGWGYLIKYLGGVEGIKQKVFRKIDMEPNATEAQAGVRPITEGSIPAVMRRS